MVFNSGVFIYFLVVVFSVYWCLQRFENARVIQNRFLLLASYFFYGWWDYVFLSLLLLTTLVDYLMGLALERTENERRRKSLVAVSVVLNIGLLATFKYFDFFVKSFLSLARSFDPNSFPSGENDFLLNVILPVGISFYTFQSMAYTIDVYRRVIRAERNFLDFALFVVFFPQLVAGPIERAKDLLTQLKAKRVFEWENIRNGLWLILLGLYLKVYVADSLGPLVNKVYFNSFGHYQAAHALAAGHGGFQALIASIAFAFQSYCDFGGYSYIAIGTASLMGMKLTDNFIIPMYSQNPPDLFRRWHLSLYRWAMDYIYIPLGGSRVSPFRKHLNTLVVFTLIGVWHGANYTFLLWGVFMGAWVILYALVQPYLPRLPESSPPWLKSVSVVLKILSVMIIYGLSAPLFRCYDMHQAWELYRSIFAGPWDFTNPVNGVPAAWPYLMQLLQPLWVLLVLDVFMFRQGSDKLWIFTKPVWFRSTVYIILLFSIIVQGVFGRNVIYFAF